MDDTRAAAERESRPKPAVGGQRDSSLLILSIGILVLTLGSFALIAVREPVRLTRYTPLVTFHGAAMAAWYTLFVVQAWLVLNRNHRAHRVLGFSSIVLAVIMVSTGILVTFGFYEEFGRRTTFVADLGIFVNFIPLYGAAVWTALKRRFDAHKRLMLVASICMIGPALARGLDVVSVSRAATLILYPAILIGLPLFYDRRTKGSLHSASKWAIGYSLLVFVLQISLFAVLGD
jgi:hypothetical protein